MTNSIRRAVCLAALMTLTPAASAGASIYRPPESRTFWVKATGVQTTRWSRPAVSGGDCYVRWETTSKGTEIVRFRAKRRKLLATRYGSSVVFRLGTWDALSPRPSVWTAKGSTMRSDATQTTVTTGPCGAKDAPPEPQPPKDCGTRRRHWDVSIIYNNRQRTMGLGFSSPLSIAFDDPGLFERCEVVLPDRAQADAVTEVSEEMPVRDLFDPDLGVHALRASRTFKSSPGESVTATTTVTWFLRLAAARD